MDDNWIVENLENALATWNEKLAEIWQLVSMTPQEFKGGGIWNIVVQINGALQAIGYGLLVLFFAMGLFKNTVNFQELRRPEAALRYFLHFVAAKAAVTYCMPLMLAVFDICGGVVSTVAGQMGGMAGNVGTLPGEISAAIGNVGFLASIPLWLVTILGSLFITVLSFILIMTVYSRFFKLYIYTALAPVPIAAFGSSETAATGKGVPQRICGRVPGRCGHRAVLPDLFRIYGQRVARGAVRLSGFDGLDLCGGNDLQHAGPCGTGKGSDRIVREMMSL